MELSQTPPMAKSMDISGEYEQLMVTSKYLSQTTNAQLKIAEKFSQSQCQFAKLNHIYHINVLVVACMVTRTRDDDQTKYKRPFSSKPMLSLD